MYFIHTHDFILYEKYKPSSFILRNLIKNTSSDQVQLICFVGIGSSSGRYRLFGASYTQIEDMISIKYIV